MCSDAHRSAFLCYQPFVLDSPTTDAFSLSAALLFSSGHVPVPCPLLPQNWLSKENVLSINYTFSFRILTMPYQRFVQSCRSGQPRNISARLRGSLDRWQILKYT
ncbi:hypothetical protein AAFF_G00286120 [Aldrovandia affinis]|uniref:Uncharacterized protein n=1 Tax=Aldrovandia affinis TaxID=143900 RepID=A0AAD7TAJ2_9TELE|nr:hypothetical protein AAFF_G00286120 [Aldrovandia affinis]